MTERCEAFIWDCHNDPYNMLSYDRPPCTCDDQAHAKSCILL